LSKAPAEIIELVDKFERNLEAYKSPNYKEAQLRLEFINPFFKSLGWDVTNEGGVAPQYRDVITEDSIKIAGGTKAPDYCFTLSGKKIFFVEAKKPSVNIEKNPEPAYQLRRYAWSAKLPLSILTDFEEMAVYESRTRPKKNDRASTGRIKYLTYKDYVDQWDYLYNTFSKDAVLKGSYDKYAETTKKKKGTTQVDDEFLSEIETWRELLAKDIALRNSDLTVDELNYSVQQIIDRIIFLRMAEDRGAEKYGQLQKLLNKQGIYQELCEIWKAADEKYNSGLFHFKNEKTQKSPPDTLTPHLEIKDGIFKQIIKNLYYPDSPYEFSVLSPEILGNVYEQFLGKVIRLTTGHRAKVEEKPEVKKAGGVYYTPQYIVEYIVENAVGKLCKDKTPQKVSELRILDPSCGSGSFLLGAYNYLLNWHLIYYTTLKDKNRLKDQIYKGKNNEWHLTIKEKKRILLNNIYGVDIDHQAVEVSKLSLLLKVLEGENRDVLEAQQKLYKERALPDLENNIKCGNSLIGPEIYNNSDLKLTADEIKRINPFDWDKEYDEIMKNGGFDAVIGNPPYLRIQGLQEFFANQIDYFIGNYKSAVKRFDLYLLFIEKGFNLLAKNGLLGFICPHKFLNSDFGSGIREFLINHSSMKSFISFGNNLIFKTASTYTGIFIFQKNTDKKFVYYEFKDMPIFKLEMTLKSLQKEDFAVHNISDFNSKSWVLTPAPIKLVLDKINLQPKNLGEIFDGAFQGVVTGIDEIYFLERLSEPSNGLLEVRSQRSGNSFIIEENIVKPLLKGEDISRYSKPDFKYYCVYPYKLVGNKTVILEEREFSSKFPYAYAYLLGFKKELKELRIKFKTNPKYWYSCHRGRSMALFERERIITPEISLGCNMTFAPDSFYHNTKCYSLVLPSRQEIKNYWMGLLNSKLMWWFISNTGYVYRGGYYAFNTRYLKPFPLRSINFNEIDEVDLHDKMVELVKQMLQLHKDINIARTPQSKELIQRQIDATDKQIDKLVYGLYGLTEDEIKIVGDSG